jgi:hypothetical protein
MEHRDERLADETRLVQNLDSYDRGELVPPEPSPAAEAYKKEPLFSKKVLFGWGLATLIVWFTLSFIVPPVVQSIREAIVTSVGERERNADGETVIRTKRGVITIRRTPTGIVIDRQEPGSPAPAAPAPAPATPLPEPVVAPVEVKPAPAPVPEATGKK